MTSIHAPSGVAPSGVQAVLVPADPSRPLLRLTLENSYQSFNDAIAARYGEIVVAAKSRAAMTARSFGLILDLWIDDEGQLVDNPRPNLRASAMAGQLLYGDALVLCARRGGETTGVPDPVADIIAAEYEFAGLRA
jgi:hypothetical protein